MLWGPLAGAQTILDTTAAWTGDGVAALGGNGVAAYGQTFTVPSDPVLQSFSVFLADFDTTLPVQFQAFVAGWNNSRSVFRPSAPVLFSSPVMTLPGGNNNWQEVTIQTGGLQLTPGGQYVFFLGTYGLFQGIQYQLKMGTINFSSPYAGGEFAYDGQSPSNGTLSQAFAQSWQVVAGDAAGADAAFTATFTAVPEPSVGVLLAAGLLAWLLRRRPLGSRLHI